MPGLCHRAGSSGGAGAPIPQASGSVGASPGQGSGSCPCMCLLSAVSPHGSMPQGSMPTTHLSACHCCGEVRSESRAQHHAHAGWHPPPHSWGLQELVTIPRILVLHSTARAAEAGRSGQPLPSPWLLWGTGFPHTAFMGSGCCAHPCVPVAGQVNVILGYCGCSLASGGQQREDASIPVG